MQAKDWRAAGQAVSRLNAQHPEFAAGWRAASHVSLMLGNPGDALASIDVAVSLESHDPHVHMERARCLLALGRLPEAREAAAAAQAHAASDPMLLDSIGSLFNLANDQRRALAAYDQGIALAPDNAHILFNRAAVRRFVGQLEEAERDYDRVIALRPQDYEAYKNRTDLRVQTPDENHIAELNSLLQKPLANWRAEVQLRYALAKEYEDLGEYDDSFRHLALGAKMRRAHMRYEVETDVATVDWIMQAFPGGPSHLAPNACQESPIFIVGLPRSGTTLIERILGSHSTIRSAGELDYFARCVVDAVRRLTGRAHSPRQELVTRSADIDFDALGRDYMARARRAGITEPRFTDKMPLNYLYCGLIRRALPQARIVHLTRHPLAQCYAMYKTLFQDGYPFSYDLGEIGRYYMAYRRLMDHWQRTLPGAILQLSYEDMVSDQLGQTRRLLDYCGLAWEDACVDFHRNPTATTTASAAQVRRRIYDSSVAQWRHYERELAPLRAQLETGGIDVDDASR